MAYYSIYRSRSLLGCSCLFSCMIFLWNGVFLSASASRSIKRDKRDRCHGKRAVLRNACTRVPDQNVCVTSRSMWEHNSVLGKKLNYCKSNWKEKRILCMRRLEVINSTWSKQTADHKAQIRKALVILIEVICTLRCADCFRYCLSSRATSRMISFSISYSFGNNLITFCYVKMGSEAVHSFVHITSLQSVDAQFESGGTKTAKFLVTESVNYCKIQDHKHQECEFGQRKVWTHRQF